ncbi:MAG: HlyD family secretion protein [Proteobacteria bacterium]|nr:HlyD family secretion protein [Pseudomonadota bacterium]
MSFAVPARVIRKNIQVGEHVEKDQVLVTIDSREFKNH